MPIVLKDILERSVVGIGSGTDYIPETLIHENGRVGNDLTDYAKLDLSIRNSS